MVTEDYTGLLQRSSEPAADALMTSLAPAPGNFFCDDSSNSNNARDKEGGMEKRDDEHHVSSVVL